MNGKQLKNNILQWAIQGKLVPQDPNDEPASVLLERIRQEKERLIKEKKIKRDKNASIIYRGEDNSYYEKFLATGEVKCIDEEIPFEIPEGWEWTRIGNILNIWSAQRVYEKDWRKSGIPFYRAREIGKIADFGHVDNDLFIDISLYDEFSKNGVPKINDLMMTAVGTLGKTYVVESYKPFYFKDGSVLCIGNPNKLNPFYLKLFFESSAFTNQYLTESDGTTVATLTMVRLNHYFIPLPPIHEQQRIVAKMDEILPLLKVYELSQNGLSKLNLSLNELLRKSILQEAIQGKLVPQIESEGTAKELLDQIQAEKHKLIKEGKFKKSALSDSVIYKGDDNKYYERINEEVVEIELPYDYPDSWCVVRLKDVCQLIDGVKMTGKGVCLDAKYLRGKSSPTHLDKGRFVLENDSIILVDGENSGEVFTVPEDGYMGSTFKQLWLSTAMYKPYLLAFILFYKEALRNSKRGAAIPHLNKELFYNLPIGIPPYKEQERIAQRIDVLFQLLK